MMIIDLLIALSLLENYVTRSDQVNTTITIPPGSALQNYLCSGPLQSNMTVVLEDGEHRPSKKFLGKVLAKKSKILAGGQDLARRLRSCHILGKILAKIMARNWPA